MCITQKQNIGVNIFVNESTNNRKDIDGKIDFS